MMARFEAATIGNAEVSGFAASADALLELGLMYSLGRDVDVDLVEAHKWFTLQHCAAPNVHDSIAPT